MEYKEDDWLTRCFGVHPRSIVRGQLSNQSAAGRQNWINGPLPSNITG